MSTLSKESTETAHPKDSAESRPGAAAPPTAGQLHSDAVSLEVPLKVHGSKVTEMVRGVPPHTEPFEEQTSSMIVFPHGGVLRMSTPVSIGQMLVLTNVKTRQDAICRVVKVRNYSASASYVEVEFTHRQPGYWGVQFDSELEVEPNTSSSAPVAGSSAKDAKGATKTSSAPSARPENGDSKFIHFGSQEQVQPAASSTSSGVLGSAKSARPVTSLVAPIKTGDAPAPTGKASQSIAGPRSISAASGVTQADPSVPTTTAGALATATEAEAASPSALESSDARAALRSAGATLGSRLSSNSGVEEHPVTNPNWLLIAACGTGLLIAVAGGTLLFHHKPASAPPPPPSPVASQPPVAEQPVAAPSATVTVTPTPPRPTASASHEASIASVKPPKEAPVVREAPAPSEPASQVETSAADAEPTASGRTSVPSVFGTLNAHPVAPTHQVNAAAPNVDAPLVSSAATNAFLGITSPAAPNSLPAPVVNAGTPIPVGGRVSEPLLLKRVLPQYPPVAREAHTQGDVLLQIVIDKAGNVVDERALAGPPVLRQAALDAVRHWKYEPTLLDGQPISVQMLVTLRFQL